MSAPDPTPALPASEEAPARRGPHVLAWFGLLLFLLFATEAVFFAVAFAQPDDWIGDRP